MSGTSRSNNDNEKSLASSQISEPESEESLLARVRADLREYNYYGSTEGQDREPVRSSHEIPMSHEEIPSKSFKDQSNSTVHSSPNGSANISGELIRDWRRNRPALLRNESPFSSSTNSAPYVFSPQKVQLNTGAQHFYSGGLDDEQPARSLSLDSNILESNRPSKGKIAKEIKGSALVSNDRNFRPPPQNISAKEVSNGLRKDKKQSVGFGVIENGSPTSQELRDVARLREIQESKPSGLTLQQRRALHKSLPLIKQMLNVDRSYNVNLRPGMYDSAGDFFYPTVPRPILDAKNEYETWRNANLDRVRCAEDPYNGEPVSKHVHRQLLYAEQLDLHAIRALEADVSMQLHKRSMQLREARKQIEAYKSLLQKVFDELCRDPTVAPPEARLFRGGEDSPLSWHDAHIVLYHEIFPPPPHVTKPEYPLPEGKTPGFIRDDHWYRSLELHYDATVVVGKTCLRNGCWEEAIEHFHKAEEIAESIGYSPLLARVRLWHGVACLALGNWSEADDCFNEVPLCNGVFKESTLVEEWIGKLKKAKTTGKFELWGRERDVVGWTEPGILSTLSSKLHNIASNVPGLFKESDVESDDEPGEDADDKTGEEVNEKFGVGLGTSFGTRNEQYQQEWKEKYGKFRSVAEV